MRARLALHGSWEFELWSAHFLGRDFDPEPPPHLLILTDSLRDVWFLMALLQMRD